MGYFMILLHSTKDDIYGKIPLIPIGSIEQHGPHLPMGTDSIIVEEIAKRIEKMLSDKILLFPTIYYTCSIEHGDFPYFGVSYITMISYLTELVNQLSRYFDKAIILNGHGGNESILDIVKRSINFQNKHFKLYIFSVVGKGLEYFKIRDLHAGTVESSIIKYINPRLVREERLKDIDYTVKDGVFNTITTSDANPHGIINLDGKVKIDEKLGEEFISRVVNDLYSFILSLE